MKNIILLILSLTASILPAFAENWVQLESGYFVDTSSLTEYYLPNFNNVYSIWTKSYNNGSNDFHKNEDYFNVHTLVDCDNAKVAVKQGKIYYKNKRVNPKSIIHVPNSQLEWMNVTKYSKVEVLYEYVCQPNIKKPAIVPEVKNTENNNSFNAADLYKQNVKAMLYIKTQNALGSGVILKSDGTFVTCFHVIADADYIKVQTSDGKEYNVNGFKYINPLSDVAILTLDTNNEFSYIDIPYSQSEVGEKVYTISNPQGLTYSFSDGIISYLSKDYIQFSAPISSGSSGGALLNEQGKLLGIITSSYRESQNINFALPNEYYISKINDIAIKNVNNEKWTDFVFHNASKDQFKLISDYAFNENNYLLLYKCLKSYTELYDFPKYMYPTMGLVALFATNMAADSEEMKILNDSAKWYEKAVLYNYDPEASLLALSFIYIELSDYNPSYMIKFGSTIDKLKNYPNSYVLWQNIFNYYGCSNPENFLNCVYNYLNNLNNRNELDSSTAFIKESYSSIMSRILYLHQIYMKNHLSNKNKVY